MQLAVIVLLRNEADIFPALAQHLAALFDIALFLDHDSIDGTTALIDQACASHPGWIRWHVTVPGTHQSRFTGFALSHIFATTLADTVFLLDADEFIEIADRAALEAALARVQDPRCVPTLAWRNAVPLDLAPRTLQASDLLLMAPAPSAVFEKAIVPRRLFDATRGRVIPLAGNHVLDPGDGRPLTSQTIGTLLHVPLRSAEQMRRKIVLHALSHLARADRLPHEGAHKFEALARVAAGAIGPDDVYGWAATYGEAGASSRPATADGLRQAGFTERSLASLPGRDTPAPPLAADASPWISIAAALLAWRSTPSAGLELVLTGNCLSAAPTATVPPATVANASSAVSTTLRAERDAAREALRTMQASTSWRMTALFRALGRAIGKA